MKKSIAAFITVSILAFILGGVFTARNAGLDLQTAFLNDSSKPAAADQTPVYTTASAEGLQALDVADIVDQASPAVVNIEVDSTVSNIWADPFYRQFFGGNLRNTPQVQEAIGSGFIISDDGYIITNQHVIDGAESIKVTVPDYDQPFTAQLVGEDYDLDLAVIKIEGSNYPTLTLGNSDQMRVGQAVMAIGQPYGLDHTVTTGVVSAKGRPITIEDRNYQNLIQTDAAINPGNSGGPLLNMQGQVIGINTAVNAEAQGIGFVIPINTATKVLDQLLTGAKIERPYMGVSMTDVTAEAINQLGLPANTSGALIQEIMQDSPAQKAGLHPMDVIVSIDNTGISSASDLQNAVQSKEVGDKIQVHLIRNGGQITLTLQLQAKP